MTTSGMEVGETTARASFDAQRWLTDLRGGGLPQPVRERWQPLRVGICNLWEYDDAEFWFADGRLVLRGGNGTGKTKILELTTLMLLRGEITASVLDPFGSQHRTMRYNLLPTGDEDDPRPLTDTGLGYAWAEFGRQDPEIGPQYVICGLGAAARRGSGTDSPRRWMFVTDRRPGVDLTLSPAAEPLEEKDLRKITGVRVFDNAGHYRAELARTLFGLAPDAYDKLTGLLKQLRRPKLGERLNPAALAETLREALPALDSDEVEQLADGWDRLQELQRGIEKLERAATDVATFTRRSWRPWARIVVRLRADKLSNATTELDKTTTARRVAETALKEAKRQVKDVDAEHEQAKRALADRRVERDELLESKAYTDAANAATHAENLGERADREEKLATSAKKAADAARGTFTTRTTAHETAERRHAEAKKAVAAVEPAVRQPAAVAGLADSVARHLPDRDIAALWADHATRTEQLGHLRELFGTYTTADQKVQHTAIELAGAERAIEAARDHVRTAEARVRTAVDSTIAHIDTWAARLRAAPVDERTLADWHDLVSELTRESGERRSTSLTAALNAHLETVRIRLNAWQTELYTDLRPLTDRRTETEKLLTAVREQTESPPGPPVLWARRDRPEPEAAAGAPLWRCVQPRPDVSDDALAAIEAALAASGLLDAWLTPDGSMLGDDGEPLADALFTGAGTLNGTNTLASVLEPTPTGGVPDERIASVLAAVGYLSRHPGGERDGTWLAADGCWRVGELTGRAVPAHPASFLGATARERARQREIARLEADLETLDERIEAVRDRIDEVKGELSRLREEASAAPDERAILDAMRSLTDRRGDLVTAEADLVAVADRHRAAEAERDAAWSRTARYAAEHAFPTDGLDDVSSALAEVRDGLHRLDAELRVAAERAGLLRAAETAVQEAETAYEAAETEHAEAVERARTARIAADTARQAIGRDHQEQLAHAERLKTLITETQTAVDDLSKRLTHLGMNVARAEETLQRHGERREAAERDRDTAMAAWWVTVDLGLADALGVPVPDVRNIESARESSRAARRLLDVARVDEQAQEQAWRTCVARLQELRQNLLPDRDAQIHDDPENGDLPRVTILADTATGYVAPVEASNELAAQVQARRAQYDEEKRDVLTRLLGSTFIEHLKDRLDYASAVFTGINSTLAAHPSRQGHTLRLSWQADPSDPEAGQVVDALQQGYEHLSEERQTMVRGFLERRIDEARRDADEQSAADWTELLETALDYRRWLRIHLQYQAGPRSRWQPFDAARHGSKSGGEKVVLLSQPLFAAAVVAYNAADRHAPRMVWLDEAMTGVDGQYKASFMGLVTQFDLDVTLTAHDEWCTYPTVPAVAIYDLARQKHVPGVDALPYLWCGGELTEVDLPLATSPPDDAAHDALHEDGLFANNGES